MRELIATIVVLVTVILAGCLGDNAKNYQIENKIFNSVWKQHPFHSGTEASNSYKCFADRDTYVAVDSGCTALIMFNKTESITCRQDQQKLFFNCQLIDSTRNDIVTLDTGFVYNKCKNFGIR